MPKTKKRVDMSADRKASSNNQLSFNNGDEVRQRRRSPRLNRPITPETPVHIRKDKGKGPLIQIYSSSDDDDDSDNESFVTAPEEQPRSYGEGLRTPSPSPFNPPQQQSQQRCGSYLFPANPAFGSSHSAHQRPRYWESPNVGGGGAGIAASGARAQPAGDNFAYRPFVRARQRRGPRDWTYEELYALERGMRRYAGVTDQKWAAIKNDPLFRDILQNRTNTDLKDKARNERKNIDRTHGPNSPNLGIFAYVSGKGGDGAKHYRR